MPCFKSVDTKKKMAIISQMDNTKTEGNSQESEPVVVPAVVNHRAKPRQKKSRRLTARQVRLVRAKIVNPDATLAQLGLAAGYNTASAPQIASKTLNKPNVQEAMAKALSSAKLDERRIAQELGKGLDNAKVDGRHGEYLDRLIRLKGLDTKDNGGARAFQGLEADIESRGVYRPDGSLISKQDFLSVRARKDTESK